MEDHKLLWRITVHLSSLISLIPTDGKLILLCDRLNPINSVCPIFTSHPSHALRSPGNLAEHPSPQDQDQECWDLSLDERLGELAHLRCHIFLVW